MSESVRIIKKYQNRKLYDTQDSCYVTLDGIAKMIREGEEIIVIDNNSKADVTALILTQVLYEQEKTHQSVLPVEILKNIIKSGSNNLYEFLTKYVLGSLQSALRSEDDLKAHIDRLAKKGDLSLTEAENLLRHIQAAKVTYRDLLDRKIDERIDQILAKQTVTATPFDFEAIANRISSLEARAP